MASDETPSDKPARRSRSLRWFLPALVLCIVTAGGLLYWQNQQAGRRAAKRDAVLLKDRSLARLENFELDEAAAGFRSLAQQIPGEPLGERNLAITLLTGLLRIDRVREPQAFAATLADLEQSLSRLRTRETEQATALMLSARLQETLEQRGEAVESWLRAGELRQADPVPFYQAYQLMQQRVEDHPAPQRAAAIRRAHELAPENLGIVVAWLRYLAESESGEFVQALGQARELFKPLSARLRDTLSPLLDKATAAARTGDWRTVRTQLGFTNNLLLAEIAFTHDLNRLNPHPLEYAAGDFSPAFYAAAPQLVTAHPAPIEVTFTEQALLLPEAEKDISAVGVAELTLDGTPELMVVSGSRLRVYSLPPGESPLYQRELSGSVTGLLAADLDRDYQSTKEEAIRLQKTGLFDTDQDLILWGPEGLQLLRNDQQADKPAMSLQPVPLQDPGLAALTGITDVAVTDLDHDGDLDLCVVSAQGVTLWSNRGNWTFEDFTAFSRLPGPADRPVRILPVDIDRNVLNDFLVAAEAGLFLLENNLHGRYLARAIGADLGAVSAAEVLDVNRDASWDVVTTGAGGTHLLLGETLTHGGWKVRETTRLAERGLAGVQTWDFNNDGFDDLLLRDQDATQVYAGGPDKRLTLQHELPGSEQVRILDADADGDQDVLMLAGGQLRQAVNEGGNANHWIDIRLRAEEVAQAPRERSNMHGVGTLLELKSGGVYQARTVRDPVTRFGLGRQERADVLRMVWPNGIPQNVIDPEAHGVLFAQQQLKGSCPYLYTWNGERFVFATDCLWAAPIGLQFAQGILAPAREWEYLKLSDDLLKPREGEYLLQMTEELWEAAYYDAVKLQAIDHPAEVRVFTNEKVGPAELAEFKVHTVTQPRAPVSVVDQRGRDLAGQTRDADGKYTRTWDESYTQGLTETHWLELDLGKLGQPREIKLYLTGWVFPTDTSLNIAIAQNPEMPRPQPPALLIPDARGEWQTVSPYIGFPGGKTKTMVVDLSGKFTAGDYRLRIVTNMEIRWDQVFFTVDEPPSEYRLTDLPLLGADLHYRGFSARVPRPHQHHEDYDYSRVTTAPIWPPMGGNFTRYGDVTELLREADDLQAVLGAGDELTVRFRVPAEPLPAGWVRDFILYNVGWDKDADLNTVQGQQVEPLPFRGMKSYPYEPNQTFPSSPRHQDFLRDYQTRFQPRTVFRTQVRDWQSDSVP